MDFWGSVSGKVQVRITSADLESLLNKLNQSGITLYNLVFLDELTCTFYITREKYEYIRQLCSYSGIHLSTVRQNGLYWAIKRFALRPILLTAFIFFLTLAFHLPSRVLFLQVEGNTTVPKQRIMEAAENCGIRFGSSRREVRSEKVKNALIAAVPELQWAGVNTKGCVATISVRERTNTPTEAPKPKVSDIVAAVDGYILSATASRGTALVKPGEAVIAGQTLISGMNDLGMIIQATAAEGEIYAETVRHLTVISPSSCIQQKTTGKHMKKISLLLGKKRINLWKDSGISGATCGRMYKELYVNLPGSFVLPLALCVETYQEYEQEEKTEEENTAHTKLITYAEAYLLQHMIAGQIMRSEQQWTCEDVLFLLKESFVCKEMIGRQRQEQIGDIHE